MLTAQLLRRCAGASLQPGRMSTANQIGLHRRRGAASRGVAALVRRLDLRQGDALICVDVQRDFLPGGTLAVPHGGDVVAKLNAYMSAFEARRLPIFLTRDWHPHDHCSFTPAGGVWPPHCVQQTSGAQWAEGLRIPPGARIISKGLDAHAEAYSGFSGTPLLTLLRDLDVRRVFVGGLATDYCVHATVLDARAHGFEVVVFTDAIRGVNATPGDDMRALKEMAANGATVLEATQ